ncbi:MAG: phosphotransferase family protein [Proteobacteria bacterium]|nr:phosphotransferase family protein [Pseudomonadota bacterium]
MSTDEAEILAQRLSALLPGEVEVAVTGIASLGAQRRTLFLDVYESATGRTTKAVAQIAGAGLESNIVETVEHEARLLRAAELAGVVVPHILVANPESGTIISELVEGESIPRRILRLVEARPELGAKLTADCGRAFGMIHQIPTEAFEDLQELGDPERYAAEMETLLDSLADPHPTFRLGVSWLRRHASPFEGVPVIVHGDFRLGNFLASDRGLTAVLDWELVHRGDPMEDLAWLCLRTWRFGADALVAGGFGSLEDLRTAYEKAGGQWREEAFRWWTVARTLWWGLGLARQAQAYLDGLSTSIVLAASGRRVVELEYDLLRLMDDSSSS